MIDMAGEEKVIYDEKSRKENKLPIFFKALVKTHRLYQSVTEVSGTYNKRISPLNQY